MATASLRPHAGSAAPLQRQRRSGCCRAVARGVVAAAAEGAGGTRLYVARRYGIVVEEEGGAGRKLRDYVRLPADKYNVLDNNAVKRVDDSTFRITTGRQKLLFIGEVEPVGYIQIQVLPNGVAQQLQRAELVTAGGRPNRVVDEINKTLTDLRLTNLVTAGTTSGADGAAQLQCQLALEGRFTSGVLSKVPEARLNGLMSWALAAMLPWFLGKLREDYSRWQRGLDRRQALGSGELSKLAAELSRGGRGELPAGVSELPLVGVPGASTLELAPTADETAAPGGSSGGGGAASGGGAAGSGGKPRGFGPKA